MAEYRNLLSSEIAQAGNIKDKNNRLSVIEALKSVRELLKDSQKVPSNGLIIVSANVMMPNRHVYEKVVELIEPVRPITK
jgi:peptide chain release factor subunit 1